MWKPGVNGEVAKEGVCMDKGNLRNGRVVLVTARIDF